MRPCLQLGLGNPRNEGMVQGRMGTCPHSRKIAVRWKKRSTSTGSNVKKSTWMSRLVSVLDDGKERLVNWEWAERQSSRVDSKVVMALVTFHGRSVSLQNSACLECFQVLNILYNLMYFTVYSHQKWMLSCQSHLSSLICLNFMSAISAVMGWILVLSGLVLCKSAASPAVVPQGRPHFPRCAQRASMNNKLIRT